MERTIPSDSPLGAVGEASAIPALLTVSKSEPADYTTLGDALRAAGAGTTIRVLDDAEYDESLSITDQNGVSLESPNGAVLNRTEGGTILTLSSADQVQISGFRFRTIGQQHAIEIAGSSVGTVVSDCQFRTTDPLRSGIAIIYVHGGASGTDDQPLRLTLLDMHCGGVGIVVGGHGEVAPVRFVSIESCRIKGATPDYGVPLVMLGVVEEILVARNVLTTGTIGASMQFSEPRSAQGIQILDNSFHGFDLAFNLAMPANGAEVEIKRNLVIGCDSFFTEAAVEEYQPWFEGNWWERTPDMVEPFVQQVAEIQDSVPLISRDPEDMAFLQPDPSAPAGIPGALVVAPRE